MSCAEDCAAGLLAPSRRLHVLRRGLAAGLLARTRGLAAGLLTGALGLKIAATGGTALRKTRRMRPSPTTLRKPPTATTSPTATTEAPATGTTAPGKAATSTATSTTPTAATSPTTPLGFYLHGHKHAHQEQATPRCPLDPLLRAHRCCPPVVGAAPDCSICRGENAICAAPAGGVKVNRASGTSGARFQSLNCAQNCGRPSACR